MADDAPEEMGLPDLIRDPAQPGDEPEGGLRRRDRAAALVRRASRRIDDARDTRAGRWLEARARDAADYALRRESLETLQTTLMTVANFGLAQTRRADPDAALLFDFLEWLELKHGREQVARTFADKTPVLSQPWLDLLQSMARPWESSGSTVLQRNLAEVRDRAAELLGELAGLEHPDPPPRRAAEIVDYFDDEWIPERFRRLALRVEGRAVTDDGDRPAPPATTSALARFVPTLADPGVAFLVTSLLAVSNAYLGREVLERFPDMIDILRDETNR